MLQFIVGLIMGVGTGLVFAMVHHAIHMADAHPDRYQRHNH